MQDQDPIPLVELLASGAEERDGHAKANTIIRSSMAIVSIVSSSTLIWMIQKSRARLLLIYHRILLGMSVADIILSLGSAHFNFTAPSDDAYFVWNAKGNQWTCSTQGFVLYVGMGGSMLYSCSINLYSLAVIKYKKTDTYIRTKIEPFLHGVSIGYGMICTTVLLAKQNLNDNGGGNCYAPVYKPPHCIGYKDGEVREGFDIPCGRGHDGAVIFYYLASFFTYIAVPLIVGVSLVMIFKAVLQQEQVNARYGAGAFTVSTNVDHTSNDANSDDANDRVNRSWSDRICGNIRSAVSVLKNRQSSRHSSSTSNSHANSRVVLRRAFSFTSAYFLTWSFVFMGISFDAANKKWPLTIWYLSSILFPLQGFFNLCIFLLPKVSRIKSRRGDDVTWCQAIVEAIWSSGNSNRTRGRIRDSGPANRKQQQQQNVTQPITGQNVSQSQMMSLEADEEVQASQV